MSFIDKGKLSLRNSVNLKTRKMSKVKKILLKYFSYKSFSSSVKTCRWSKTEKPYLVLAFDIGLPNRSYLKQEITPTIFPWQDKLLLDFKLLICKAFPQSPKPRAPFIFQIAQAPLFPLPPFYYPLLDISNCITSLENL